MERKRTKKKYIVISAAALDLLGISTGAVLANDKIKLIDDKVVIEAGTKMDLDISKYVDVPKSKLKKLKIDTSKVDTSKVGEYEMTVTYKEQVLTLKVKVTDTLAPVIEKPKKALKAKVGEEVFIEKMALSVKEASDYTLTFEDGKNMTVFDTSGKVKKKVIATDIYNNTSEIELTFKVADENAPVFEGYGTKDRTVYLENGVDLMDGVFAKDAEDGDLTDKIKVSKVDTSTLGEKEVTYTVEDSTGNVSTLTIKLTIESVLEELDQTMYATTAVSIRSTSSAKGEKLGDLSFAQEVHVIGRDKNTGWYRIEHEGGSAWVSDSYLSDSKPTVRTPSNNQQSASAGKSKAAAADSNCAADCNCDCGSDCDCATDCQADCVCADCDCSACEPATDCLNCDDSVTFCDCGDCWIGF